MKNFKITLIIFFLTQFSQSQQQVSFSIQAHQDDWQLFMSSNIINDLSNNTKVVFITLTAGDAGIIGNEPTPFYKARENGSVYSSKFAQDLFAEPNPVPIPYSLTQISYTNNTNLVISHNIARYEYKNCVNYFFRLPDGNITGNGFSLTGNRSLQKLKLNQISFLSAIDGSTTFFSWDDLTSTIKQIILNESGNDNQVWINTSSINLAPVASNYNPNDHSDHRYTSIAARDAVSNLSWVGIAGWVNYHSANRPSNLTNFRHQESTAIFAVANWGIIESGYDNSFNTGHQQWLPMDYYAIDRFPVGNKKLNSKIAETTTRVPLVLNYKNPIALDEEISINVNIFETGNLKIEVFNLLGQLINEEVFLIEDVGVNNIVLQKLNLTNKDEICLVKITLNDKYLDTFKLLFK
ncbi:hypothetical protein [Flavobacterium sp.]|jgi:hypothetical protein|uniref:hypothetical protein n=1 Tax=Flavobacterium sp. TaxID=239 RepID=UPI0037C05702